MDDLRGTLLLDRYRADELIGRGGMGTVYRATDTRTGQMVAAKVLSAPFRRDAAFTTRFAREAQALLRLHHPNIIRVLAVGPECIVMEFAGGGSLSDRLVDHRPMPPDACVRIGSQIAAALHYAHERGIVHRDVKPSNILLDSSGRPVLTDFGIARLAGATSLTATDSLLGTPHYMSPEQIRGRPADPRSDVYALGAVCYEMLTGRPPFAQGDHLAILHAHVYELPVPPRQINPAAPPGLQAVVMRSLDKNPANRQQTAAVLSGELLRPGSASVPSATGSVRVQQRVGRQSPGGMDGGKLVGIGFGAAAVALVVIMATQTGRPTVAQQTTAAVVPAAAAVASGGSVAVKPGRYAQSASSSQTTSYDVGGQQGSYTFVLTLDSVEVSAASMTFGLREVFQYSNPSHTVRVNKRSDVGNNLIYVLDNLGNRYDHTAAGGDFARSVVMEDDAPASGYFIFPAPRTGASSFTFRMDDQRVSIGGIVLR